MSHYATPFIVINLGCEMLYVIEQRLKAQQITREKSEKVLTDIVSILLHPKLLDELFLPQPVATHGVIKQLLQDISATSIMKLDEYSMSKLWDLMTMIYKWQLAVATNQNVFDISLRHLTGIASILPEFYPKCIIEQAIRKFEALSNKFTDDDYKSLNSTLILWFSEYHSKISVLLRLGLQRADGTFILPAAIDRKILWNLGNNIYQHDTKNKSVDDYETLCTDTIEINCLLAQIGSQANPETKSVELHLPIDLGCLNQKEKKLEIPRDTHFESISINVKNKANDLTFAPVVPTSPHEDLIAMFDKLGDDN